MFETLYFVAYVGGIFFLSYKFCFQLPKKLNRMFYRFNESYCCSYKPKYWPFNAKLIIIE